MNFASIDIKTALEGYGFENLPDEKYWNKENEAILARAIIDYLASNLENKDVWVKFEFILEAIFDDNDFCDVFADVLGEYFGNKNFAINLLDRAKTGSLMWSHDCYELIERLEKLHQIYVDKVNSDLNDNN